MQLGMTARRQRQFGRVSRNPLQVLPGIGISRFCQLGQTEDDCVASSDQLLCLQVSLFSRDPFLSFMATEEPTDQNPGNSGLQSKGPHKHVRSQQDRVLRRGNRLGIVTPKNHLLPRMCDETRSQAGGLGDEQHQQETRFAHEEYVGSERSPHTTVRQEVESR